MKPEKIITALNDIDTQFIREARETAATPCKSTRRFTVLIAAVIAMTLLLVGIAALVRKIFRKR